jgi:TatD DNase family protein
LFHCFSEGVDEIVELNNLGGRASFTGILTYKKNDFLREAAKAQGMGKLILETDSPYLSPEPMRGKENEPSNLALIGEYTSGIFDVKKEDLALQSFLNTNQFYGV